jgi:hypothetical protein
MQRLQHIKGIGGHYKWDMPLNTGPLQIYLICVKTDMDLPFIEMTQT